MTDSPNCTHRQFTESQSYCPDCGLSRSEVLVATCEPFLKDDETPAECIARNRRDASGCLTMLIDERRKVEALRSRLADSERLREDERLTWDAKHKRQASMNAHLAALVTDAQEELRKCQQDAILLQARLAEAEAAIEAAGRCLVMSNNGAAEALTILRGYKQADSATHRENERE